MHGQGRPATSRIAQTGDARHHSSVHFRLHGPGFLNIPLVLERRSKRPESTPPPTTIRTVSERISVIQSPGRWSAWPRTAINQLERADAQYPTMAAPGVNIEALTILQADNLSKLIESLQGFAVAMTAKEPPAPPTPTQSTPPHIPTTIAGEDEAILWEQIGTGHVLPPEVPPPRTPPPVDPTQGKTREGTANPPTPSSTITARTGATLIRLNIRGDMQQPKRIRLLGGMPRNF